MKMFYIVYHCQPNKKYAGELIGGAYIGCWIATTTLSKVDKIARKLIKEQNWSILETDEEGEILPGSMNKKNPRFEYYEQALIDKEVLVFYTYPKTKE
jgi:hypothetical protein